MQETRLLALRPHSPVGKLGLEQRCQADWLREARILGVPHTFTPNISAHPPAARVGLAISASIYRCENTNTVGSEIRNRCHPGPRTPAFRVLGATVDYSSAVPGGSRCFRLGPLLSSKLHKVCSLLFIEYYE